MKELNLPTELQSDGCTFPGILKIFKKILGSERYHDYCREHDFLRRYDIVKFYKADWLLARRIASTHFAGVLRAPFYFLFTFLSYPFYRKTRDLPPEWESYAAYYRK